jgi:hypothetical protein
MSQTLPIVHFSFGTLSLSLTRAGPDMHGTWTCLARTIADLYIILHNRAKGLFLDLRRLGPRWHRSDRDRQSRVPKPRPYDLEAEGASVSFDKAQIK